MSGDSIKKYPDLAFGAIIIISTLLIYLLSQFAAVILVGLGIVASGQPADKLSGYFDKSAVGQAFIILLTEAGVILLVWLALRYRKRALSTIGLIKPRLVDLKFGLIGIGIYYASLFIVLPAVYWLVPSINSDQKQDIGFNNIHGPAALTIAFISLVILPPIGEEILARGYLYSGLRERFKIIPAAIVTSLMFGAAHLEFGSGNPLLWSAALNTLLLSFVLVGVREKSGSIWPGSLVHAGNNLVAFFVIFHAAIG